MRLARDCDAIIDSSVRTSFNGAPLRVLNNLMSIRLLIVLSTLALAQSVMATSDGVTAQRQVAKAVGLQFDDILASEGMGSREKQADTGIQLMLRLIPQGAIVGMACLQVLPGNSFTNFPGTGA